MVSNATAAIFGNTVSESLVGIDSSNYNSSADVYGNTVFDNGTGIQGYGTFGGTNWSPGQPNDVHDNTTGIDPFSGTTVQFNNVQSNVTGIDAASVSNVNVNHNVIDRNTGEGILADNVNTLSITSNTVYSPSGDAVRIRQLIVECIP